MRDDTSGEHEMNLRQDFLSPWREPEPPPVNHGTVSVTLRNMAEEALEEEADRAAGIVIPQGLNRIERQQYRDYLRDTREGIEHAKELKDAERHAVAVGVPTASIAQLRVAFRRGPWQIPDHIRALDAMSQHEQENPRPRKPSLLARLRRRSDVEPSRPSVGSIARRRTETVDEFEHRVAMEIQRSGGDRFDAFAHFASDDARHAEARAAVERRRRNDNEVPMWHFALVAACILALILWVLIHAQTHFA